MNKLTDTENRVVVTRRKEGWGEDEEGQGSQIQGDRRLGYTGGEPTIDYTDVVSSGESCRMLLTGVTYTPLFKKILMLKCSVILRTC